MSFKEFFSKKRFRLHFFSVSSNNQILYYCGVRHFTDPKDIQFELLKKTWISFLQVSKKKNSVVLIEGELRPKFDTAEKALLFAGDPGLVTFLAMQEEIPIVCPEPNPVEELNKLKNKYSLDQIMYYYFARHLQNVDRYKLRIKINKFIEYILDKMKDSFKDEQFDFTLENIKRIYKEIYGQEFTVNFIPVEHGKDTNIINRIASDSVSIRDVYIMNRIKLLWDQGKNIFAVFGSLHAIREETAIKIMLKTKS